MTEKWSHLPNANHIDWVIKTLEENPDVWDAAEDAALAAAWAAAWRAAWDAASAATLNSALVAARDAALAAAWDAAWDAAWGAIAALVAWDDSSNLLDKSVEEVKGLARAGNHAAVLLLPAVIVENKLKENKMTKDESHLPVEEQSLVFRLQKRAEIRRQIPGRKSVQEGSNDRIADLLEEAARIPSEIIDILKNDDSIRHHGMTTFTRDVIDAAMAKAIKLIEKKYNV